MTISSRSASDHLLLQHQAIEPIARYLLDVLGYLHQQEASDNLSLLLIGDQKTCQQVQAIFLDNIKDGSANIPRNMNIEPINVLTPVKFLKAHFNQRYDLACFVTDKSLNKLEQSSVMKIVTRMRDLFAKQCVVITSAHLADKINLRSFAYIHVSKDIEGLAYNDDKNHATAIERTKKDDLFIWQFNLYDYKPKPDWLNAKYWANPENFDKYRW